MQSITTPGELGARHARSLPPLRNDPGALCPTAVHVDSGPAILSRDKHRDPIIHFLEALAAHEKVRVAITATLAKERS